MAATTSGRTGVNRRDQTLGRRERDEASNDLRPKAVFGSVDPAIDLSIVVVSWNTREVLRACLSSLHDTPGASAVETIVVDNGSHDGTVEMVTHDFPTVRVLVNARNIGFAAANEQGLATARGRYVMLLNSDTVVRPGALQAMTDYMDGHLEVGALGPRLLNADGTTQVSAHDFPRLDHDAVMLLEVKHWPLVGDLARRYQRARFAPSLVETRRVDWVVGAALLLRREALAAVDGLDTGYFFFFEDSDLCCRLWAAGWPTVLLAGADVVHLGGQSRDRTPGAALVYYYKGLLRYYRRNASRARYLTARAGVTLGASAHVAVRLLWPRASASNAAALAAYLHILGQALRD